MYFIPSDSLSRLSVVMADSAVEMMNLLAVLDPLIKNFIQVSLVIGLLSFVVLIILLKKIEIDNPDRIRWK
jgi:hypothetical protein